MSTIRIRRRIAVAGLLAAAAIGSASPAYADVDTSAQDCDTRLVRLEAQFRDMEARHGWDAAAEWWQARWQAYFQSCIMH